MLTALYSLPKGETVVRENSFKLAILALVIAAALVTLPAASATSITDNLFAGTTQIGTVTLTQGGMCNGVSISSTSVCVDIQMTSGAVRLGGPVIGFSGNVSASSTVSDVSVAGVSLLSGACGGIGKQTICFDATGSATASSLFFVLSNADTSTGITIGNVHVAGSFCAPSPTCFATTSPTPTVIPEPGTLGLLGTGLVGFAALVRRRFLS
jgi:hypothetical protein